MAISPFGDSEAMGPPGGRNVWPRSLLLIAGALAILLIVVPLVQAIPTERH